MHQTHGCIPNDPLPLTKIDVCASNQELPIGSRLLFGHKAAPDECCPSEACDGIPPTGGELLASRFYHGLRKGCRGLRLAESPLPRGEYLRSKQPLSSDSVRQQPPFRRGVFEGIDTTPKSEANCRSFLPDFGFVPEVGTRSGSSAIDRLARSARALASFASYADPLLSQTEIVSWGP